jgi:hypothetical protein
LKLPMASNYSLSAASRTVGNDREKFSLLIPSFDGQLFEDH